jgi:branched-chain amino acid transport system permease protein
VLEFAQLLAQGVAWGSVYALIALGYTMVYGVLRLINFAHGDVYMVGAFIAFYVIGVAHLGLFPALVISMLGCAALGVIIERAAYRPLRTHPRLAALITAIGVSLLLENGGQLLFGPEPKPFPREILVGPVAAALGPASASVERATGIIVAKEQMLIIISALAMMGALQLFVARTKAGRAMRAVAADRATASLMGIDTDSIISLTFALGSALAAAAGVLVSLEVGQIDPLMGLIPGLKAFVAAVLGGIGNIPGAMAGGVVMGIAECLVVGYVSSSYRDAIAFAILIAILLVKPTGLTGKGQVEKV